MQEQHFLHLIVIRTIIPARGRKLIIIIVQNFFKVVDKNHNPRKGTETFSSLGVNCACLGLDKNHNPRKGTETTCKYK